MFCTVAPRAGRRWRGVTSYELLHSDWCCSTHQTSARARVLLIALPDSHVIPLSFENVSHFIIDVIDGNRCQINKIYLVVYVT